jgi:serine/threonine protein kinase
LFEGQSAHDQIAVKVFDSWATQASNGSPAQIGTEFAAVPSLWDALPTLDAAENVIVWMKSIHSRETIHRDLKPASLLLGFRPSADR